MRYPLSLSSCWLSDKHVDGGKMLEACARLGFEQVELSHGIPYSLWPGILEGHRKGVVRISSLHNFCPLPIGVLHASPNCYEYTDERMHRRRRALQCTFETIDHAVEVEAPMVVLHLGSTGQRRVSSKLEGWYSAGKFGSRTYVRTKLKAVLEHEKRFEKIWPWVTGALAKIAEYAKGKGVRVALECRERVEEIPLDDRWPEILKASPPEIGFWYDFGHASRKEALGFTNALELFKKMTPYLAGCHVHDLQPPDRDHVALGEGIIPFEKFWPYLDAGMKPIFVLELSPQIPEEKVKACLKWWKENGPG